MYACVYICTYAYSSISHTQNTNTTHQLRACTMAETTVRKWESLVSERNWLLYGCIFFTTCTVIFASVFVWAYGNWQWELNNAPSPNMPPPPTYPPPSPLTSTSS